MSIYESLRSVLSNIRSSDILIEKEEGVSSSERRTSCSLALAGEANFVREQSTPALYAAPRRVDKERPSAEVWQEIRKQVFQRDGWACQITGCINSGDHLECHHIEPVAKGGAHVLDNLVTLCHFHHACQINHDIQSMKERADTSRYWIRPTHRRAGHQVAWHFGRKTLVTADDLKTARSIYQFRCPCGSDNWLGYFRPRCSDLIVLCPECEGGLRIELGLQEETCIALADFLVPTSNLRSLSSRSFDPDIVGLRIKAEKIDVCPYCFGEDRPRKCGYLQLRKSRTGDFLGCVNFSEPKIRCPYRGSLR